MSIKRFVANKDTTITNAYLDNYRTRGTDANMGAADSLEVFSLYGQVTTSSVEQTRFLVQFPTDDISEQRVSGNLPASGSVSFYLRLFNVKHPYSVPRQFTLSINPISRSWEEGYGLDMENYTDVGFVSGTGGTGTTWTYASSGSAWTTSGGDVLSGSGNDLTYYFETGLENIELDITNLVESWITGTIQNNGLLFKLSGSYEDGTQLTSFYTKKFSARGSEFYFNRPCIEARWDPTVLDDRNNFYASSSLLGESDNIMNLYFYNKARGVLKNVVNNPTASILFYTDSSYTLPISASYSVVTNPAAGIYRAQVAINTTASVLYDKWVNASNTSSVFFTSSFDVIQRTNDNNNYGTQYVINLSNLKPSYTQSELARMNIFVRERDWQPNIYTVANNNIENTSIPNLYYKVFRLNDNYVIIDYSTGSVAYSKTSYDSNGNYFELNMDTFEKDYGYGIKLATWDGSQLKEFKETFKFRVI